MQIVLEFDLFWSKFDQTYTTNSEELHKVRRVLSISIVSEIVRAAPELNREMSVNGRAEWTRSFFEAHKLQKQM